MTATVSASTEDRGDVLAGLLPGVLVAVALCALTRTAVTWLVTAASRTRLRPIVAPAHPPAPSTR